MCVDLAGAKKIDVLYNITDVTLNISDFIIDFNVFKKDIQVFIVMFLQTNKLTNIDIIDTFNTINSQKVRYLSVNSQKCKSTIFALDTAATKHICCDLLYFSNFKNCNKTINWGQAK